MAAHDGAGRVLTHDPAGRALGRGVYVCRTQECFARAVRRSAFGRALRIRGGDLRVDVELAVGLTA